MARQYQFWLHITDVTDGDTVRGWASFPSHVYLGSADHPIRFRLAGINCPELDTAEGQTAAQFTRDLLPPGEYLAVSNDMDQYGRPLVDIATDRGMATVIILAAGMAAKYQR